MSFIAKQTVDEATIEKNIINDSLVNQNRTKDQAQRKAESLKNTPRNQRVRNTAE